MRQTFSPTTITHHHTDNADKCAYVTYPGIEMKTGSHWMQNGSISLWVMYGSRGTFRRNCELAAQ